MPFEHLQKVQKNIDFQVHFICTLFAVDSNRKVYHYNN